MKYAGVVVLYNPDINVIDNIKTYMDDLDRLYVIDNSDTKNYAVINQLKLAYNVVYIDNKGNKGIANAQNRAAIIVRKEKFHWLLTMDQDSSATKTMIPILKEYIENNYSDNIGIVSAYQKNKLEKRSVNMSEYQQVLETMSSGNMLNLKAYQRVGKFKEKLFIDMVDYEYCLRLNKYGYKIIVANKAILNHNLGDIKIIDNTVLYSHSPERLYYYVRNNLYVLNKYKEDFPSWISNRKKFLFNLYLKTFLYDTKKVKRLYYFIRGYLDYLFKIYGKMRGL
jgi:Predicted glycosyltransferases